MEDMDGRRRDGRSDDCDGRVTPDSGAVSAHGMHAPPLRLLSRQLCACLSSPVVTMSLAVGDVLNEQVHYDSENEPQMSSDSEDDRPYSPPPVARLEPLPLIDGHMPMSKTLSRLHKSQVRCISCITPYEFYVRRPQNDQRFKEMQKVLNELCNCFSHHPTDMRYGDLIAVYSHPQKSWCRATFLSMNQTLKPARSRCSILSKAKGMTIRAFLTDYGYMDEHLFLFNVKGPFTPDIAPFDMNKFPILHDRCCLNNVKPFNPPAGWSEAAIQCTKRLICNSDISVVVRKVEKEVNYVDVLYSEAKGKHAADLALALHMADYARIPEVVSSDYKSHMRVSSAHPKFRPAKVPRKGDLFSAVVDYIVSPDLFFVTWASKENELIDLQKEINDFYQQSDVRETQKVSVPLLGLPVITTYSDDGCYYRALVIDILMKTRKVRVLFVDYGNEEDVLMTDIFHVDEKFMQKPLLASVCSLSDVRPCGTHKWSDNASAAFKDMVAESMISGHLSVRIQNVTADRLHVVLSKWIAGSSKSVSIADEMIERRFARKNIPGDDDDSCLYEQFKNEKVDAYQILTEIHCRRVKAEMGIRDRLIEVQVFHVNSPSDLFVQLADPKIRQVFFSMNQQLDQFMSRGASCTANLTAETNRMEVGDWCAIQLGGTWCRGKVTHKHQVAVNGTVSFEYDVMSVDGGYPQNNKKASDVILLPVEFQRHCPYAIRVSLAEISPAGGADWLKVSTDKVVEFVSKEEFRDNLFLLLNQPPPEERPEAALPVSLVAVTKEIAGALLPEKVTYHVLNDLMAGEWGVAIGTRRPRGQRFDTDILNDSSESTICPRAGRRAVDVPFDENSLISRMQSVYFNQAEEDMVFVYDETVFPEQSEFQGLVTHIDEQMNVHFQLSADNKIQTVNQKIIEAMRSEPLPVMKDNYMEDRACTALFHFDSTWNRAKILGMSKRNRSHIRVLFVDYGQREEVVAEHISSAVICRDIPPLALKASICGVKFSAEKREETINELRNVLVDRICLFSWKNATSCKKMKVSIRRPLSPEEEDDEEDGFSDVQQWLLNKDLAVAIHDSDSLSSQS